MGEGKGVGMDVGEGTGVGVGVGVSSGSGSPTLRPPRDAIGLRRDLLVDGMEGGACVVDCGRLRIASRSGSDAAGAPGRAGSGLTLLPRLACLTTCPCADIILNADAGVSETASSAQQRMKLRKGRSRREGFM